MVFTNDPASVPVPLLGEFPLILSLVRRYLGAMTGAPPTHETLDALGRELLTSFAQPLGSEYTIFGQPLTFRVTRTTVFATTFVVTATTALPMIEEIDPAAGPLDQAIRIDANTIAFHFVARDQSLPRELPR